MYIRHSPGLLGMASDHMCGIDQGLLEDSRALPELDALAVSMGVI